ncbi:MAG: hypothetical protein ACR2G6_07565, partial [Gemmatimonadaceae bacterium]
EPAIELEEMVVETPTFSWQDYIDTRVFHLLMTIFFYEGNIQEAFEFARQEGVKPFDLLVRMQSMLGEAPAAFRHVIAEFLEESEKELFSSREACHAWAVEHMDQLINGSLGGNLLSKYSMLGRFYATREGLDFLEVTIKSALADRLVEEREQELTTVMNYLRCVLLQTPFAKAMKEAPLWVTSFDVESWRDGAYSRPLESYRFEEPRTYATAVELQKQAVILSRIATFGENPSGLGKFTRTMFAQDLRRMLVPLELGMPMKAERFRIAAAG